MKKQPVPRARTQDLVIEELPDETLVYDVLNDTAHCLDKTTADIWKHCNGEKTLGEVAELLEIRLKAPVDERLVQLALDQLSKHSLLEERFDMPAAMAGMNRRQLVRTLGLAGLVALPMITSLIAPTAAHAQSGCVPNGQPCGPTSTCCSQGAICSGGICQFT